MSSPAPQKSLRATGPILVVILIVFAAALGYYQILYYPAHAPTSKTIVLSSYDPHNVTVAILPGAGSSGAPRDKTYSPNSITVVTGYNATVIWINNDTVLHTVTANTSDPDPNFLTFGPTTSPYDPSHLSPNGQPESGVGAGESLNYTFTQPGTYGYFCSYHNWMIGTIIVKQGSNSSSTGATTTPITSGLIFSKSTKFYGSFVALTVEATDFAKSLATLTGSGTAPWSVNLSRTFLASTVDIPAFLRKIV